MDSYLYFEPYVFISLKKNGILFYNFLNKNMYYLSSSDNLYAYFLGKKEELAEYIIDIKEDMFLLEDFIQVIKSKYMGDLITQEEGLNKPVIFTPIVKDLAKKDVNGNLGDQLIELTIYLPLQCSYSCGICREAWIQFPFCSKATGKMPLNSMLFMESLEKIISITNIRRINLIGLNFENEFLAHEITEIAKHRNIQLYIYVYYKNVISLKNGLNQKNHKNVILFDTAPSCKKELKLLNKETDELLLVVQCKEDIEQYESFLQGLDITYSYTPYFSGNNLSFFEEYLFRDEEDIQNLPFSETVYMQHTLINTSSYGKLFILPNGNVKIDLKEEVVGSITSDIKEIIYNELNDGKTWKNTRAHLPYCSDCVYEVFCPSPGSLERFIRPNTCHIKV